MFRNVLFGAVVSSLLAVPLFAQDATGRIVGSVLDASGAAVSGAKVAATNAATKLRLDVQTDTNGAFQILLVPIGVYDVTAEAPGFRRARADAQKLEINQSLRIDFKLELGQVTETIQVEGVTSGVETVNVTLGNSVTDRPIINMPLNGRNVLQLAQLQPGVTPARPASTQTGLFNVAGGRQDSVTFLLDGGLNNNLLDNGIVLNPNPDAVAEFRILTSNYTAEFGRNGSGVVSVVTKSGSNDYHGSGFEFLRNEAFNANRFFNNANGVPREVLKRNQFGFTLGGPVSIPKVFDGKDKLFFFNAFQGQRLKQKQTAAGFQTYSTAELRGDFSQSVNGGPDPGVVAFLAENPFFQSNPSLASRGIIDPARFDPVAKKYIEAGLIDATDTGRLFPQGLLTNNNEENTTKIDFLPRQNDRIFVTLGFNNNPQLRPFPLAGGSGRYAATTEFQRRFGNIGYTKIITPTLLNEFRMTAQRSVTNQNVPASQLAKPAELGVGINSDRPSGPPIISFNSGLTLGFSNNGPANLVNNTFLYSDVLTWTKGKHNLRGGFFYSAYQNNTVYDFYVNGAFFFSGPAQLGGIGSGNDRADFLFGLPDQYLQYPSAPSDIRSKAYSTFFQDEWRVTSKLTLTAGVRYEYAQPKYDTRGRSFSLAPGQKSSVFVNAPTGIRFPGDDGAPRGANNPDRNDFAPRFGFAYAPTSKWSFRGGFGIFHDILKGEDNLQFNGQAPFYGFAFLAFDPLSANPARAVNYLSQPFAATGQPNPFPSRTPSRDLDFAEAGFLPLGGGGVYFVNPNLRTPYIMQYNFSVQRELMRGTVLEMNYVGSGGRKLTALADSNPFIFGTQRRVLNTAPGNSNSSFTYLDTFNNFVNANYNSLQLGLSRRPASWGSAGTVYYQASYTYGKSIDNASGFRDANSYVSVSDHRRTRSVSDFDLTHNFVLSGGWDLPFAQMLDKAPKKLLAGWALYPILSARTGFPVDVRAGITRNSTSTGPSGYGDNNTVRADLVAPVTYFDPKQGRTVPRGTGNYYFDPSSFSIARFTTAFATQVRANPSLSTYGTLGRNAMRDLNVVNFDLALAKTTTFGERFRVEIRAEAFNVLNNVQFAAPDAAPSSGTFGQIRNTLAPRIMQMAVRVGF